METKEEATISLLNNSNNNNEVATHENNIPNDSFNLAYIIYFILGTGFMLPWNAFITAVDYFDFLYPDRSVDRIFAVVYQSVSLVCILLIVFCFRKSHAYIRINVGLGMFLVVLSMVVLMDLFYIKGTSQLYDGFYITVGALGVSGIANALLQGGIIGSAAELPKRYLQAAVAGTSASGVIVSFMRIFTKAVYPQNNHGLRNSALLYFIVAIISMTICLILYNVVTRLPVIEYYTKLRNNEQKVEQEKPSSAFIWTVMQEIKWYGLGVTLIYTVTLSIFPGSVTEDVHSTIFKDWYAILLITCYNVFDLLGKCLTAVYLLNNANIALGASVARLLFYPLYLGCLRGPRFFRTEIPVTSLTSLLGLTTGYLASVLMVLAPKMVQKQYSETAGMLIVVFLILGLAIGSVVSWFWVI